MATKDWKVWDKVNYRIRWINTKKVKRGDGLPSLHYNDIFIIKYKGNDNLWTFVDHNTNMSNKEFKTKSQALAYAKAYMRKH